MIIISDSSRCYLSRSLVLTLLVTVCGCSAPSVSVPTQFPIPVVEPMPFGLALHLDDNLTNYVHREELAGSGEWEIDLGVAQKPMFENLFSGMFYKHVFVEDAEAVPTGFAGVVHPSIEEVQFSTPKQTRSNYFEVWIRYQFKLVDADGSVVGEWPLTAYGKANVRNYRLKAKAPALQAAALAACRDAMAFFTLQFPTVPSIKVWLDTQMANTT